ncbi:MAG: alginate lyase family protein [Bacteroidetes bacterium]|nr:alginate lyase family protein [Bacteroidota bacterium]
MRKFKNTYTMILLAVLLSVASADAQFLYFDNNDIDIVKSEIKNDDSGIKAIADKMKMMADYILDKDPVTLTSSHAPNSLGSINDYYSESPYWWPDPINPDGEYIRKDGQRNPERFLDHKKLFAKMYAAVTTLGISSYLFNDERYASKAEEFIEAWFVNPRTRMNPNMEFAQIIKNKPVIRGVGIIETHNLVKLVEAFNFLNASGYLRKESFENTQKWFSEYLNWMLKSEFGVDEKDRGNNHSSWWAAQAAAYSFFIGDKSALEDIYQYSKSFLIENQIEGNGQQPLEEARTLSLSYYTFNLNALSTISAVLKNYNMDLFNYKNKNGGSIIGAIDYLIPYLLNKQNWDKEQIKPAEEDAPLFLGLAGLQLNNEFYLKTYETLYRDQKKEQYLPFDDPFEYLMDMVVITKLNKK